MRVNVSTWGLPFSKNILNFRAPGRTARYTWRMCGAFTITKSLEQMLQRFKGKQPPKSAGAPPVPRYNARPSQQLPLFLNTDPEQMVMGHWGIKPAWMEKKGLSRELINARAESSDKPTFRKSFATRRCLVPADGFYEWMKTPKGKQPYRFVLKGEALFAFAGIYEEDRNTGAPDFAIITTQANGVVRPVHDRMPVILLPEDEEAWLNPDTDADAAVKLLKPYPDNLMEAYPVSRRVNSAANDGPELVGAI